MLESEQQEESEQQADSALSVLQEQTIADSSIFISAMMVDPSSHIDGYRYEETNLHIEEYQYEIALTGRRPPRARTSHWG